MHPGPELLDQDLEKDVCMSRFCGLMYPGPVCSDHDRGEDRLYVEVLWVNAPGPVCSDRDLGEERLYVEVLLKDIWIIECDHACQIHRYLYKDSCRYVYYVANFAKYHNTICLGLLLLECFPL